MSVTECSPRSWTRTIRSARGRRGRKPRWRFRSSRGFCCAQVLLFTYKELRDTNHHRHPGIGNLRHLLDGVGSYSARAGRHADVLSRGERAEKFDRLFWVGGSAEPAASTRRDAEHPRELTADHRAADARGSFIISSTSMTTRHPLRLPSRASGPTAQLFEARPNRASCRTCTPNPRRRPARSNPRRRASPSSARPSRGVRRRSGATCGQSTGRALERRASRGRAVTELPHGGDRCAPWPRSRSGTTLARRRSTGFSSRSSRRHARTLARAGSWLRWFSRRRHDGRRAPRAPVVGKKTSCDAGRRADRPPTGVKVNAVRGPCASRARDCRAGDPRRGPRSRSPTRCRTHRPDQLAVPMESPWARQWRLIDAARRGDPPLRRGRPRRAPAETARRRAGAGQEGNAVAPDDRAERRLRERHPRRGEPTMRTRAEARRPAGRRAAAPPPSPSSRHAASASPRRRPEFVGAVDGEQIHLELAPPRDARDGATSPLRGLNFPYDPGATIGCAR